MQIKGFQKTTLLDYPGHLASTIFIGGCDFRCPFCHNASLVTSSSNIPSIPFKQVIETLIKRKHILEGICITGGEPTLSKELPVFIEQVKTLDLKVKLDTNGNNPSMLDSLLKNKLIDYIAMDIKNSKENYSKTIGISDFAINNIEESIQLIMNSTIDYEFRTTVVKEIHTANDFIAIGKWINGSKKYFLQSFTDSGDILQTGCSPYSKDELNLFKEMVSPYVNYIEIRGID